MGLFFIQGCLHGTCALSDDGTGTRPWTCQCQVGFDNISRIFSRRKANNLDNFRKVGGVYFVIFQFLNQVQRHQRKVKLFFDLQFTLVTLYIINSIIKILLLSFKWHPNLLFCHRAIQNPRTDGNLCFQIWNKFLCNWNNLYIIYPLILKWVACNKNQFIRWVKECP